MAFYTYIFLAYSPLMFLFFFPSTQSSLSHSLSLFFLLMTHYISFRLLQGPGAPYLYLNY